MAPLVLTAGQRSQLEYLAAHNPVAKQRCRARALLWLDEGESPELVAEALLVSRRTVDYWAERFRDREGLDPVHRLADAPRPGRPRTGGEGVDRRVAEVIDTDPRTLGSHPTVWTAPLLVCYLRDHHGVGVSRRTVSRALARLDIRWQRPRHRLARRPDTWRQSKGG
jgi:transposase